MKQTVKNREKRALLKEAAADGRGNDSMVAHVAKGEIVIPVELARHPEMRKVIAQGFEALGTTIDHYTVGHEKNSKNPETGEAEFLSLKTFAGTIIGGGIGYLATGTPQGAITGAKIGAGVDVTRAAVDNAKLAREQAAQAQATAIEEARKAREQAASEAQKSREATALEAQKARELQSSALEQQKADAAARLEQTKLSAEQQAKLMQDLTAQQRSAADLAQAQLAQQQKQYEEQKLTMEKQASEQAAALEEERRKIAQRESAQMTARRRSGRRSLLSEARLNPELGITQQEQQKTLLGA
jgi:flagellar biosynthesis GTPase FlhF